MKANDVLYQLKQLVKMVRKGEIDITYFSLKLKKILKYCKEMELKEEKKILFKLMGSLQEKTIRQQYIEKLLLNLTKSFSAIVEKEKVMLYREAKARVGFFKSKKRNDDVSVLQYGDIVKVPTQGGIHYSIVTGIAKDMVECFPLTTSSANDLHKLGVRSIPVQDFLIIDGIQKDVRLTASKTRIPTKNAVCNRIGTFANIDWLKNAITTLSEV